MADPKKKPKEAKKTTKGPKSIVGPIALLTIIFFFAQYAYQIYHHTDILYNGEVYNFFGNEVIRSGIIDLNIMYYLLIQVLLIISYIFIVWLLVRLVGITFKWTRSQMRSWGILIWVLFTIAIWATHEYYYPYSDFAIVVNTLTNMGIVITAEEIKYAVLGFGGICAFILLLAFFGLALWFARNILKSMMLILLIAGSSYLYYQKIYIPNMASGTPKQTLPNIVLINLDSLQTQQLSVFNPKNKNTPYINNFLNQSTVFTKNVTPSLQEFPTWISIFTGEYPKINGMIQNYMPIPKEIVSNNLIKIAQNKGYKAIYISDNSRTAKMELLESFDQINAPPGSFSNLLIGESNDFIVSNLLTNTPIGPYLFPFSYGSRDIAESYAPESLIQRTENTLNNNPDGALFLVINMTLSRWPYGWRNSESAHQSENSANQNYELYQKAVKTLDEQFNDIISLLKEKEILQDSIVIVFSDKGESFNIAGDNLITAQNFQGNQDVSQVIKTINQKHYFTKAFHTLLAVRYFDKTQKNQTAPVSAVTSSVDIYATLSDFLGIKKDMNGQSRSLLPAVLGNAEPFPNATVYFESGYNMDRLTLDNPNLNSYLTKGLKHFSINCCTGTMQLKPSAIPEIEKSQSYGRVEYPNIILQIPSETGFSGTIIYNMQTKTWSISNQNEAAAN